MTNYESGPQQQEQKLIRREGVNSFHLLNHFLCEPWIAYGDAQQKEESGKKREEVHKNRNEGAFDKSMLIIYGP